MNSEGKAPRAIVTGAAGFLGRQTARALCDAGFSVAGIGHGSMNAAECRETGFSRFLSAAISETAMAELMSDGPAPSLVFHAAGGASVSASLRDPEGDRQKTLGATEILLKALRNHAPKARLIFASSAAVYGEQSTQPIAESAALAPLSPYGEHKMLAERACLESGMDLCIIRFFSLYGPHLRKQILWDLMHRLAPNPEEIQLGGLGTETRDFLFVADATKLILQAAAPDRGLPVIVNGGTGTATTVRQLAETVVAKLGARTRITFSGIRPKGDPTHLVADARLVHEHGFTPEYDLDRGLSEHIKWARTLVAPETR